MLSCDEDDHPGEQREEEEVCAGANAVNEEDPEDEVVHMSTLVMCPLW
jgi:hypothetical protein